MGWSRLEDAAERLLTLYYGKPLTGTLVICWSGDIRTPEYSLLLRKRVHLTCCGPRGEQQSLSTELTWCVGQGYSEWLGPLGKPLWFAPDLPGHMWKIQPSSESGS